MTSTVTPSALWQGTPSLHAKWTVEQLRALERLGKDPDTVAVVTIMRRPRVNASDWTMPPAAVPLEVPCAAYAKGTGRSLILTPAGDKQWVETPRG